MPKHNKAQNVHNWWDVVSVFQAEDVCFELHINDLYLSYDSNIQ